MVDHRRRGFSAFIFPVALEFSLLIARIIHSKAKSGISVVKAAKGKKKKKRKKRKEKKSNTFFSRERKEQTQQRKWCEKWKEKKSTISDAASRIYGRMCISSGTIAPPPPRSLPALSFTSAPLQEPLVRYCNNPMSTSL